MSFNPTYAVLVNSTNPITFTSVGREFVFLTRLRFSCSQGFTRLLKFNIYFIIVYLKIVHDCSLTNNLKYIFEIPYNLQKNRPHRFVCSLHRMKSKNSYEHKKCGRMVCTNCSILPYYYPIINPLLFTRAAVQRCITDILCIQPKDEMWELFLHLKQMKIYLKGA